MAKRSNGPSNWARRQGPSSPSPPPFTVALSPDRRLRVHPGGGTNTETDLYGEGDRAAWNNQGDVVTLLDDDGNVIDSVAYGAHESETVAAPCD